MDTSRRHLEEEEDRSRFSDIMERDSLLTNEMIDSFCNNVNLVDLIYF